MKTALKAAPLCEIASVGQFLSNLHIHSKASGSLDMNALDVLYEELAKDEDVPHDVDEEFDASS